MQAIFAIPCRERRVESNASDDERYPVHQRLAWGWGWFAGDLNLVPEN